MTIYLKGYPDGREDIHFLLLAMRLLKELQKLENTRRKGGEGNPDGSRVNLK